jgi:polyketide biosynthesis enoyl-CoA hydratase PksH
MGITNNNYKAVRVASQRGALILQLYRPEANNSINATLAAEIKTVLTQAETENDIKVIVIEGLPDHFCTGMDLKAVSDGSADALTENDPNEYFDLLTQFSCCSKVIIAKIEGKVNAGGIGLIAASDIVIAGHHASFGLSEALFGLLPACIMPFLIRRIGYQKALWMALTTQSITANRAYEIGLVDEVSSNIEDAVRRNLLRLTRLEPGVIKDIKNYSSQLWIINEQTKKIAADKFTSMISSETVQNNIKNFVQDGKFPWDK